MLRKHNRYLAKLDLLWLDTTGASDQENQGLYLYVALMRYPIDMYKVLD